MPSKAKAVLLALVLLCCVFITSCAPVTNLVKSADDWIKANLW